MAKAQARHTGTKIRDGMTLNITWADSVWSPLWRPRAKLSRGGGSTSSPPRLLFGVMAALAALAMVLPGCVPDAPGEAAPGMEVDSRASAEGPIGDGEPSMAVLASFALDLVLYGVVTEDEEDAIAQWYFVDAMFAPYAHDGRQYPPEDTRGWVEREEPLTLRTRTELERLGLTVCEVGSKGAPCEDLLTSGESYFALIGIGETRRASENRWSFDFGFVVGSPSGSMTGAARIGIRSQEGAWLLTSATTLWLDG